MSISNDIEKEIKIQEYRDYLYNHINNVIMSFNKYIKPLKDTNKIQTKEFSADEFNKAIINLEDKIKDHDKSKYSKHEFDAYRIKFYPTKEEQQNISKDEIERMFDAAWQHHYRFNSHHPQYWVEKGEKYNMPLSCILEMICDWVAMSIYFNSSTIDWWLHDADKEKSFMTNKTKKIVEDLLFNILNIE